MPSGMIIRTTQLPEREIIYLKHTIYILKRRRRKDRGKYGRFSKGLEYSDGNQNENGL